MTPTITPMRPRVAIDAHTLGRRATGNETYVRGLISGLTRELAAEAIVLADRAAELPPSFTGRVVRLSHRHPAPRLLLELATPRRQWGADLLHVQYVRPPRCDAGCVTTIHDISFEHFADLFPRRTRARMRITIPWSARHSRVVLTGSEHARNDILTAYGLPPERVKVTPYAADPAFVPMSPPRVEAKLQALGITPGYLLCVGNVQPRKNLRGLLRAYESLHRTIRPRLVVVGQASWRSADVYSAVERAGIAADVHFTGFVSTDQLVALYNGAAAFAYPSLYEGFGLPVLEALACGVPTLTSDRSSLPEVAGDAALLVDPESIEEMRVGLERLLCDTDLRKRLAEAGPRRARAFSWRRCAELTVRAYRDASA